MIAQYFIELLRRYGRVRLTAIIAVLSCVGSLLLTWTLMRAVGVTRPAMGLWIGGIVPLVLATPLAWIFLTLLQRVDSAEQQMRYLATRDDLTGVYNRRYFTSVARRALTVARQESEPVSLVMFDADEFKSINDRHGHPVGDEVLQGIAHRAGRLLRHGDVLARFGGEEFVVLLPGAAAELAAEIGERIRLAFDQQPIRTTVGDVTVSVSVGVAAGRQPLADYDTMLREADVAVYLAKAGGRNRVELYRPQGQAPEPLLPSSLAPEGAI